jgi:hypothetical protein
MKEFDETEINRMSGRTTPPTRSRKEHKGTGKGEEERRKEKENENEEQKEQKLSKSLLRPKNFVELTAQVSIHLQFLPASLSLLHFLLFSVNFSITLTRRISFLAFLNY